MSDAEETRALPARQSALLEEIAALLDVERLVLFGGAALDLLTVPSRRVKDLDIALPLEGRCIPPLLIRLQSCGSHPSAPVRPYMINLDQPVLMVEHHWRDHHLDINFVDDVHRIPQFDIESVQWRYPECNYLDLYGAFHALAARTVRPIWRLDQNNPWLLLNRVLRLAAKYDLRLAGHGVHQTTIEELNHRIECWDALDDFHGRQAREAHYRTIPSAARRANDPIRYLRDVAEARAVSVTVPELQGLLDRGSSAWEALSSALRTDEFWTAAASLLPDSQATSLTARLALARPGMEAFT